MRKHLPGLLAGAMLLIFSLAFWIAIDGRLPSIMPINIYSADPNERMQELLENSEDLRKIKKEWKDWSESEPPQPIKNSSGDDE